MAAIDYNLHQIREAVYGEEVRGSIVGAIEQCYADANDVVKVSENQPVEENVKLWVKPTSEEYKVPTWEEHLALAGDADRLQNAFNDYQLGKLPKTIIKNSYVKVDGDIEPYNGWDRTDYIPVKNYKSIIARTSPSCFYNMFYDSELHPVGTNFEIGTTDTEITVPNGADYVVFSHTAAGMRNLDARFVTIAENDLKSAFSVLSQDTNKMLYNLVDQGEVEITKAFFQKNISTTTGDLTDSTVRSTSEFIFVPESASIKIVYNTGYKTGNYAWYASDKSFLGANISRPANGVYYRFSVRTDNGTDPVTPTDAANNVEIYITVNSYLKKTKDYFNIIAGFEIDDMSMIADMPKNVYDKTNATFTVGMLQEDGSISTTGTGYADYSTTQFIELNPLKTYSVAIVNKPSGTNSSYRRVFLLYDMDKNIIPSSYKNGFDVYTFTGASYIRLSYMASVNSLQNVLPVIDIGNSVSADEFSTQPTNKTKIVSGYGAATTAELGELQNDFANVVDKTKNNNLIDLNAPFETGGIQSDGSIIATGAFASYLTSDYIELDTGESYIYAIESLGTNVNANYRRIYLLYNAQKEIIQDSYKNDFDVHQITGAKYIRVSFSSGNVTSQFARPVLQIGTILQEYEPYGYRYASKLSNDDVLAGKKWWACGDSFTELTTETYNNADYPNIDGHGHYKTYPFWIGVRTGMTVYNFAVSGQTMAMPANPGTFTNAFANDKYKEIPVDVDYITLKFGINDSHHAPGSSGGDGEDNTGEIPIGDITDTGTSTFCGAYNTVLAYLIEHHPNAKIGILVSNGCETDEYRQKTIAIAQRWGLPWLDENGESRCPALIRSSNPDVLSSLKTLRVTTWATDYPTNTHPNVDAHKFESTIVEAFLRSL